MYEQFYGFSALPFVAGPAAGDYYFSEQQRRILEELEARVGKGNGVYVLSGAEGVGKTTLIQSLREAIEGNVNVYSIDAAQTPAQTSLAENIIATLGVDADGDEPDSPEDRLSSQLLKLADADKKSLLVIDSADSLTAADSDMLVTRVVGTSLSVLLVVNQPGSEQETDLADQIAEYYTLLPFSPVETDTYIRVRLIQAGGSPELFTPAAGAAVYRYSNGLPRLINRICDLALIYGFSRQSKQIDDQTMDFVLKDRWGGGQQQADADAESHTETPAASESPEPGSEPASDGATVSSEAATERVPLQQALKQPEAADPDSRTGASNQPDAAIARQLVELLRQDEQAEQTEPKPNQTNDRDVYEFIRLSMQYHQRHVERFTLGVAIGVVLLAAGGFWGFIAWQDDARLPAATELASQPTAGDTPPASVVKWETQPPVQEVVSPEPAAPVELRAGVVKLLPSPEPAPEPSVVTREQLPSVEQAALELAAKREKAETELSSAIAEQAELTAAAEAKNRTLEAEQKKLERDRKQLKKKLAAQRAENKRLKRESEREHERALKAQQLVKKARKSAHLSWDKANVSIPDAFPED